jgi:hypothetical protein
MITRDYIMRMINQLAASLARVLFLKNAREFPQALTEIQKTCKQLIGADLKFLRRLSDVQLIELLGGDRELASSKYYVLGMLFKEQSDIDLLLGRREETLEHLTTSLSLLIEALLNAEGAVDAGHAETIDHILQQLRDPDIPTHIRAKVFSYHERVGTYDKAEDVLFDLISAGTFSPSRGLEFYERLLKKPAEELLRGNLPRQEVEEGLATLRNGGWGKT